MKQKVGEVTTVYGCYNRIYLDFGVNECLSLAHRVDEVYGFCKLRNGLQTREHSTGFRCQELAGRDVQWYRRSTALLRSTQLNTGLFGGPCGAHGIIRQTV